MKHLRILHCSATREDHGGIQSVLAYHHERDEALGFSSRFVSYFDREARWPGDCVSLAGHGWETVRSLRHRFAAAMTLPLVDVAVYHDGWGLDWFAPLDAAARRVVLLHTEQPNTDALLRRYAPYVDGFFSVSQTLADRARRVLPDFPAERIHALPLFVDPPAWLAEAAPRIATSGHTLRLGYAGRLRREHKRLDRLPELIAALDQRGLDYVFEVLGDGPLEATLRRQLESHPRVKFLGWREGNTYWQAILGWDALVLLSDFEGFSRVTMEAMMGGVIPVHPEFSPAAAELLGPAAAAGLYPVGDMAAAAQRIAGLGALSAEQRTTLVAACRLHLKQFTPENYFTTFGQAMNDLATRPARSHSAPQASWREWLPIGLYTRWFRHEF
jgi:glycosyltransferase involved in cell wall biosynthesis